MDTQDVLATNQADEKLKKSKSSLSITEQLNQVEDMLKKPENQVSLHDLAGKKSIYSDFLSRNNLGNGWEEIKLNNGLIYYENVDTQQRSFEHPLGADAIQRAVNKHRPSVQSLFYNPSHISFSLDAGLSVIDETESEVASIAPTFVSEASIFDIGHEWAKVIQPDGTQYYFNKRTGESRWNMHDNK
eukprot:NODE_95_length_21511_cov_0.501168.p14 type:complete len:187 gc:universal NODE_95_length_21511_cov_0.501168:10969-11529(+)